MLISQSKCSLPGAATTSSSPCSTASELLVTFHMCKQGGSDAHPVQKQLSTRACSLNQAELCSGSSHHHFAVGSIMREYWYVVSEPRGPLKHEGPQFSNLKKEGYTIRNRGGKELRKKGGGSTYAPQRVNHCCLLTWIHILEMSNWMIKSWINPFRHSVCMGVHGPEAFNCGGSACCVTLNTQATHV